MAWGSTNADYLTDYYYDTYVWVALWENSYRILYDQAYGYGEAITVTIEANAQPGAEYEVQTTHAVDIYYQVWELDPYCGYTCYDWADYWGYSFISNEPPYGGPTYTSWIWYPPAASINWYAAHLNLGELSDEVTIIGVDVQSVSIPNQTVSVKLEGGTASGVLTVQFLGDTTHTIYSGTKGVGTHSIPIGISGLPDNTQFTQTRAVWTAGGMTESDTQNYSFKVLGTWLHSQYNTPTETSCVGSQEDAYKTTSSCSFEAITLKSDFRYQANLNGNGRAIAFGLEQNEALCLEPGRTYPPDAPTRSFRPVSSIVPSCSAYSVGNNTVARGDNSGLDCGDQVYIHGIGIKTVTDRCPDCTGKQQLDNYTTAAACAKGSIDHLGNFKTIRLR